jgi:phosphoglycolate phosphatase
MDVSEKSDQLRGIRAAVFDFDGTLAVLNIDFSQMRDQVFKLMRNHGIDESSIEEKYLLEIIDEVALILSKRNSSAAEEFYQKAHLILHEIEMKAAEEGKMLPGVKETLISLKRKGIKVGIVTRNCEEAVRKVLPDIEKVCDVFISRDLIKKVKPHPEQLTSVVKALHVTGEETLIVGDHTIDIQAGKRVGMKTVGVLTGRTQREEFEKAGADWILEDASEICELIPPCPSLVKGGGGGFSKVDKKH